MDSESFFKESFFKNCLGWHLIPLRFVLANDPGAGKTIMAGLLMKELMVRRKELMVRSDVVRCLIVCPGTLIKQWQEELQQKFHLAFEILTSKRM